MERKNFQNKIKTKSGGIHNIVIPNKASKPIRSNKINKFNQINDKRALSDLNNEKATSNTKTEKALSINLNNKTSINNKTTKRSNSKNKNRSKSYNLIQKIFKKDIPNNNKRKQVINNINVNINQINNIQIKKEYNTSSLNKPRTKSINKIINTNKPKKPSTNYNAFKTKPKSINKISISKTEEKGLKKSPQKKQVPKSNLFPNFIQKEKKSINSSYLSKINNKNNKHPLSAKSMNNKNAKNNNIGKANIQKPKTVAKKNSSIDNNSNKNNNNKIPKQFTNKIQSKEKMMELITKNIFSYQKKEKEKDNNKNKNFNINNKINNKNNNNKNKPKDIKNKIMKPKKSDEIPIKINLIKTYSEPTLIGLNNIGATCFINSTLQCLSQTEELTNYFLDQKHKDDIINKNNIALENKNENQLSPPYYELINKLWEKNEIEPKSYSPDKFVKIINEMNPLFKLGQAGDSKDFIIYILEQIHRELKKPIKMQSETPELDQYDKAKAYQYFLDTFRNENSIISDLFFGVYESTTICLNCKKNYNSKTQKEPICYSYGIFNCLIFPLEEIKNLKLKNNPKQTNDQVMMNSNNVVNMNDCFNFYQKSDLFTGDNKNYCNICQQLFDTIYTTKIYSSPKYLILILNRGKGNIYNIKLDFPEILNISQFVIKKEKPNIIYNLYGVLTHFGESGPNAHFFAACKSPVDGKWYRYNDAIVTPIKDFQKDVIDFGTPYILFYQKMK